MTQDEWHQLRKSAGLSMQNVADLLCKHRTTVGQVVNRHQIKYGCVPNLYKYALLGILNAEDAPMPILVLGEEMSHKAMVQTRVELKDEIFRLNRDPTTYHYGGMWVIESYTSRVLRRRQ